MTLVTARILDPNGNVYSNSQVEASFISNIPPGSGTGPPLASGSVFQTFSVSETDSFGNLSMSLTDLATITPSGGSWNFNVLNSGRTIGFSLNTTAITGVTVDISAALQAVAAPLNPATGFSNITVTGLTNTGNELISGTLGVTGKTTLVIGVAKNFEGVLYADQFPGTSFDAQVAAAIAALPTIGSGTVDCRNMTNLSFAANLVVFRSNTRLLFGQYTVSQGTFSLSVPAGTNNIAMIGMAPIGSDPGATQKGTYFTYTGTGSAHSFGDTSGTSYNHLIEGFTVDITGAGNSAVGIDSSRVYHTIMNYPRVIGKIGVTSQIGIRNNGTTNAPGSQNCLIISPYLSNCFIGIQAIGGNSPPTCNMNQIIGGEITGSGSGTAGSIGFDVENGNNNNLYGFVISNYETAIKVASTSNRAVYGDFHSESVVTAVNFGAGTGYNWLFTDSGGTITDSGTGNSVIRPGRVAVPDNMGAILFANGSDLPLNINLQAGSSANQVERINFKDKASVTQFSIGKDSGTNFTIDDTAGFHNVNIPQSGNTVFELNAPSGAAGTIDINSRANAGTTGIRIWSGGSAPIEGWDFGGGTTPLALFKQPANKVGQASITADSPGINTTETVIVKSATLAANRLVAGTVIRAILLGTCTSTVGNTSTFQIRIGTAGTTADTLVFSGVTAAAATTGTNIPFRAVLEMTIRSTGAAATAMGSLTVEDGGGVATGISTIPVQVILPTMNTFNTTTANNIIDITYQSAAVTTTCIFKQATIEIVYQ